MIDKLEIQSGLAKRVLNTLPYLRTAEAIAQELDKTEVTRNILQTSELTDTITKIKVKLMQVKDIRGTANRVTESQVLDDIELFELKAFSLLVVEIRELLLSANITVVTLPDLEPVVNILDPEKMRIPHFYVYDAYSPELAALRAKMKTLKMDEKTEERVLDQLQFEHTELEDRIREKLNDLIEEKQIPVVAFNTDIIGTKRNCFVGLDNWKSGQTAAGLMGLMMHGKGKVLGITGYFSNRAGSRRIDGFIEETRKQFPEMNLIGVQSSQDDAKEVEQIIVNAMKIFPDLKGIFVASGGQEGVKAAFDELNLEKRPYVIIYDVTPENVKALNEDTVDFLIDQEGYEQGYRAVSILEECLKHGSLPEEEYQYTEISIKTKYNVQ